MKKTLLILLLLTLKAVAQLPITTIHVDDSTSYSITYPSGGTVKDPAPVGGGFFAIDIPNNMGILISTKGSDVKFRNITTDKPIIYTAGSKPKGTGVDYIPDNPVAYRNMPWNDVKGFEVVPVMFHHDAYLPPSQFRIDQIKREIMGTSNMGAIVKSPRLLKLLQTMDDRHLPQNEPHGNTDLGWQIRHYAHTFGGRERVGYYSGVNPRGSAGFDNWHYSRLLMLAYHYALNPRQDLYNFGIRQAIAHACYGRTWWGPNAGFARYEKGQEIIGQNFSDKAWEKQWSDGLIVWYRMTGNPVLGMQLDLMRAQLKKSNPDQVWKGYWGARIGSHYLKELLLHYLHHREQWIIDKAAHFLRNVKKWRATDYCWDNRGNGGGAPESPWMQSQLVEVMFRWIEHVPSLASEMPITDLMKSGAAVWNKGHNRVYGKPMFYYRFRTKTQLAPSMHLTAFALPMLRYMAAHDRAKWGSTYDEVETFIVEYAGTDVGSVAAETPTPIDKLGYRFAREGSGWAKALMFYLIGMI